MCMLKLHDQLAPIITASNEMTHKVLYLVNITLFCLFVANCFSLVTFYHNHNFKHYNVHSI